MAGGAWVGMRVFCGRDWFVEQWSERRLLGFAHRFRPTCFCRSW
jgi:hypothetical protein